MELLKDTLANELSSSSSSSSSSWRIILQLELQRKYSTLEIFQIILNNNNNNDNNNSNDNNNQYPLEDILAFKSFWDYYLYEGPFNPSSILLLSLFSSSSSSSSSIPSSTVTTTFSSSSSYLNSIDVNNELFSNFESFSYLEKLSYIWNNLIHFSQSEYKICPLLLTQQIYIPQISQIITFLILIAPSKPKYLNILSCLIISPICSDILTYIIQREWIPLSTFIDGILTILEESKPLLDSSIKLIRSHSTILTPDNVNDNLITEHEESKQYEIIWDQIKRINLPQEHLQSIISTLFSSFTLSCDLSQLNYLRLELSRRKVFPQLCIQISKDKLNDLHSYLDKIIDSSNDINKKDTESLPLHPISRLDEHWLYSKISSDKMSELFHELFQEIYEILLQFNNNLQIDSKLLKKKLSISIRVLSVLLTIVSNIHKVSIPPFHSQQNSNNNNNNNKSSEIIETNSHWIEARIESILELFLTISNQVLEHPYLCRILSTLVFVFIISSKKQLQTNSQLSYSHNTINQQHNTLLNQLVLILFQNYSNSNSNQHLIYSFYIKCCLSLDRIGFIRDSCSKELCLEHYIDFLPQNSFSYLSKAITNYIPNNQTTELLLIEKNKEKLLQIFLSLPIPEEISAINEYPGDYLNTFSFILKYRLMSIYHSKSQEYQDSLKKLKPIFTTILHRISWPPHSSLQDCIDNLLDITVNGNIDNSDNNSSNNQKQLHNNNINNNNNIEGNLILMSIYPNEILDQIKSDLNYIYNQNNNHENIFNYSLSYYLEKVKLMDSINFEIPIDSLHSLGKYDSNYHFPSQLILDADLIEKAKSYLINNNNNNDNNLSNINDFNILSHSYRIAIYCYIAIKYQSLCISSSHTQYTCIFQTDLRDLPIRYALTTLLFSVTTETNLSKYEQLNHIHQSYFYSDCSFELFSSMTRLIRILCPETLIQERYLSITYSPFFYTLPINSFQNNQIQNNNDNNNFENNNIVKLSNKKLTQILIQELFCETFSILNFTKLFLQLIPSKITIIMMNLLRFTLTHISSSFSKIEVVNNSDNLLLNEVLLQSIIENKEKCNEILYNISFLWKVIHSIHLYPQQFELETINLLLELSESRNPHSICSYSSLIKEPIILFRFPLSFFQHEIIVKIIFYIHRSISIASRAYCHETYRINKSLSKQILSHALPPNNSLHSNIQVMKSPHISQVPVMSRDGSSRIENCHSVDVNEFLNLQDLITIRLLLEIWIHICNEWYLSNKVLKNENNINNLETEIINIKILSSQDMPEELLKIFRNHLSFILIENLSLIDSLLFYGFTNYTSFYLISTCIPGIILLFHEKIQSSIINHTEPYMLHASKNMESILLNIQFLLQCYLDISFKQSYLYHYNNQFLSIHEKITLNNSSSSSSPSLLLSTKQLIGQINHDEYYNESKLQINNLITIFLSFLKKSLKLHCWKQQFTVNPQLGIQLVDCLTILSKIHPTLILKCISMCTSKDLFASVNSSSPALLSPTSVLGRIQRNLYELKENIQKEFNYILEDNEINENSIQNIIRNNQENEKEEKESVVIIEKNEKKRDNKEINEDSNSHIDNNNNNHNHNHSNSNRNSNSKKKAKKQ